MGTKYCPECKKVINAKVLPGGYRQVNFNGILAKRRKVIHREADGGCGYSWWTLEIAEEFIKNSNFEDSNIESSSS